MVYYNNKTRGNTAKPGPKSEAHNFAQRMLAERFYEKRARYVRKFLKVRPGRNSNFNQFLSSNNKIFLPTQIAKPRKKKPPILDPIMTRLRWSPGIWRHYRDHRFFYRTLRRLIKENISDLIFLLCVSGLVFFIFSFILPFTFGLSLFFLKSFPLFFLNFFYLFFELLQTFYFLLINFFIFFFQIVTVQLVPELILLCGILTILTLRAYFYQIYDSVFFKRILSIAFSKEGVRSLESRSFESRLTGSWLHSVREIYVSTLAWNIFFISVLMAGIWMLFNSADYISYQNSNVDFYSGTGGVNDVFFGNHFLYDSYTYYSRFLILATGLSFLIIFKNELELDPSIRKVEYIVLIMCGLLFSVSMPAASSLISLFLIAEGLVMVMYILSSSSANRSPSGEGSMKYAILNSIASVMFILGTIFIFCVDDYYFVNLKNDKILIGLVLISLTFLFKLGAFPFQNWMADLYESSSLGVLAFFVLVPKLSIILTLINLNRLFFVKFSSFFFIFFLVLGLLSLLTGSILASSQTKLNRLLAYSSISQVGSLLMLFSLVILNPNVPTSLLILFALVYTLVSIQTISLMSNLRRSSSPHSLIAQIKDLSFIKFMPQFVQTLFSAFIFNLSGLPPFIGWVLKAIIIFGALLLLFSDSNLLLIFNSNNYILWLSVLIFISSVVGLYYSIRLYKISYEIQPSESFFPIISKNTSFLSLTNLFVFCLINFIGFFILSYVFSWISFVLF